MSEARYTVADVMRLGGDYELDHGVLIPEMPGGIEHGCVCAEIARVLGNHVRWQRLGRVYSNDTGIEPPADPPLLRGPDLVFFRAEVVPRLPKGFAPIAPDLAIEVVGPTGDLPDALRRIQQCLERGTRLAWIFECARRRVLVHRPGGEERIVSEDGTLSGEDVVPGFECRVGDIYRDCD